MPYSLVANVVFDVADPFGEFTLATDASTQGIGAVLLQKNAAGELRPCAFYSKKPTRAPSHG